jgi:hypothetical protein
MSSFYGRERELARLKIPYGFSLRPVLVHVNGVTESVEESNFFHHIIDFGQMFETAC